MEQDEESEWEDTDASSNDGENDDGGSDDNEAIGDGFDEVCTLFLFIYPLCKIHTNFWYTLSSRFSSDYPPFRHASRHCRQLILWQQSTT